MYNTIYTISSIIPANYALNGKQIKSNADYRFLLLNGNVYVTNKSMTYHVVELLQEDGTSPYAEWFRSLDPLAAAKITVAKLRLQQGNTSNIKWFGNCSGEATQSRLAGRFAGMMMPVNLDSNEAQKFSHSA
jgi:hypothetical protein